MTPASKLVVTGTSTDVGKTIATAALAAAFTRSGRSVAVCKPAQTGVGADDPGDLAEVTRLAGQLTTAECARYADPLAPDTAARRSGQPYLDRAEVTETVAGLATAHDVVLVEGAGGVLVRLAPDYTVLDVAADIGAPVYIVVDPGLGTLNHTELTVEAIRRRGLHPAGLIIGSWPDAPDLAMTCNRDDLPALTGVPVVGVIPAGVGALSSTEFCARAPDWFESSIFSPHNTSPTQQGVPT